MATRLNAKVRQIGEFQRTVFHKARRRFGRRFGIAFIVVMILAPEGVIGTIRIALARRTWWR